MAKLKINFYNKDYDAIKAELIELIKATYKDKWTDFSENDFGMIILELFCGIGDMTSFNMDNQVQETFLDTARRRLNVARLAATLGHKIEPAKSGMTKVSVVLETALDVNYTVPIETRFRTSGTTPKIFTSYENFVISSSVALPRNCMWEIVITSGTQNVSDVALTGVNITTNTDGAVIYAKMKQEGGLNKIALYKNSSRTGALSPAEDDLDKIAYGEAAIGTYEITMAEVNSSGIEGKIFIGSSDLPVTEDNGEEFHINGPTCYEGEIVTDTFTSNGEADQRFETTYNIQQIPVNETKTLTLQVNAETWTEVEDFFFERGKLFEVETIFDDYSTLIFGNSNSGQIPPTGATIIVTYVRGNGALGHVGRGSITELVNPLTHLGAIINTQQYNIQETTGAQDPELVENAKISAKEFYSTRGRMVEESDYVALIKDYYEEGMYNPTLVQAWKDETEPDLVNELEIYVLSTDTETGRFRLVDIDLTTSGGLWEYIDELKTFPEGIRKSDGLSGISDGTLDDTSAKFYYTIFKFSEYDRETIREAVRTAVENYYHGLDFQEELLVNNLATQILQIEGVQSVNIFTDPARTTVAANVDISGAANRGKVLVLPTDFYTVGETVYLKFNDEV